MWLLNNILPIFSLDIFYENANISGYYFIYLKYYIYQKENIMHI